MIERHYFKDKLLKSFDFTLGFCMPHSTNEWEVTRPPPVQTVRQSDRQTDRQRYRHRHKHRKQARENTISAVAARTHRPLARAGR